jgi:glycosyltransferase involved in cell wall biosynthesis
VQKKRVVIVSDALAPWHVGGKEERYAQLAKHFQSNDIEIIFATMKWWQGNDPAGYVSICPKYAMYNSDGSRSIYQSIRFALACLKIYRLKPDLIEGDQIPFLQIFTLWIVAKIRRIPLTVTWHEVWGVNYWQEYAPKIARFAAICEKLTMRLPDLIISNSDFTASRLRSLGVADSRLVIIENNLDFNLINEASTELAGYEILYAGRLIAHKKVEILIEAMKILTRTHPNIHLGIIGDGPESNKLKQITHAAKIDGNITFLGEIPNHKDVLGIMKKSNIFVSASEREGYGQSVLEALYLGLYVIVTDNPNNAAAKFVEKYSNGIVLEENTASLYAQSIEELIKKQRPTASSNIGFNSETISSKYLHQWLGLLK